MPDYTFSSQNRPIMGQHILHAHDSVLETWLAVTLCQVRAVGLCDSSHRLERVEWGNRYSAYAELACCSEAAVSPKLQIYCLTLPT
jgi:hypothetical protein